MRALGRFGILIVLTFTPAITSASAGDPARGTSIGSSPHVRPLDQRVADALLEGMQRSATIRSLVAELEASDVIVYLQVQHSLRGRLAGSLNWLSTAGGVRFLRVSLNPELPNVGLVVAIGHELQHAREVARARSVVDSGTLSALYRRIGISRRGYGDQWETEMAQEVGERVRLEMSATSAARVAESIQTSRNTDGFVIDSRD